MPIDVVSTFKPQLVKAIKQTLGGDQATQLKLNDYQQRLNAKIMEIHALESRNAQLATKYANALNALYQGVSAQGGTQLPLIAAVEKEGTTLDNQTQAAIQSLFTLEHEIMDFLSQGLSATNKYVIYFNDGEGANEQVFRGEISAAQLYESNNLTIDLKGISLKHSSVVDMFKRQGLGNAQQMTAAQIAKYSELAKQAIASMQDAFQQLRKELEGIKRNMQREHLGENLWRKYQRLYKLVGSEAKITGLYASYMVGQVSSDARRTSLKGAFINRGHLFEALERYVQGATNGLVDILGESLGNDPWFTQGDVKGADDQGIQVKSLIHQSHYDWQKHEMVTDSAVGVASLSSILEVAQTLQKILHERQLQVKMSDAEIDAAIAAQTSSTNGTVENLINNIVQKMIQQNLHSS